ncbi:hypothetical protein KJ903_00500 [Patescibacteria group bacterium]|nr:hypothetical protein [Patescibacteria group bacterium]
MIELDLLKDGFVEVNLAKEEYNMIADVPLQGMYDIFVIRDPSDQAEKLIFVWRFGAIVFFDQDSFRSYLLENVELLKAEISGWEEIKGSVDIFLATTDLPESGDRIAVIHPDYPTILAFLALGEKMDEAIAEEEDEGEDCPEELPAAEVLN